MTLTLMYITNDPVVAKIAEDGGVDWVFVDLEIHGKKDRQGHLDTVISSHSIDDVRAVAQVLTTAQLLVRVNPVYDGSAEEIDNAIAAGAQILMLPFFHHSREVAEFIRLVDGRAEVCLLLETPGAVEDLDAILSLDGIDHVHIGLNDLHLGYGLRFMFELLSNGTVEKLCRRLSRAGLRYGFGGIARLGKGDLAAEHIVAEHARLGSSMVILSRAFCDLREHHDPHHLAELFATEVAKIREHETTLSAMDPGFFEANRRRVADVVAQIADRRGPHRPSQMASRDAAFAEAPA